MTSIRNPLALAVGVGNRFCVELEERDGELVAEHPLDSSPLDIAVEGGDRLDERPPSEPVTVEIVERIVDGRVVGQVVEFECEDATAGN